MGEDCGRLSLELSNSVLPNVVRIWQRRVYHSHGAHDIHQDHGCMVYRAHDVCLDLVDSVPLLGLYPEGPVTD